jgi:hypothetical protein
MSGLRPGAFLFVPHEQFRQFWNPYYAIISTGGYGYQKARFFTLEGTIPRTGIDDQMRIRVCDAQAFGVFVPLIALLSPGDLSKRQQRKPHVKLDPIAWCDELQNLPVNGSGSLHQQYFEYDHVSGCGFWRGHPISDEVFRDSDKQCRGKRPLEHRDELSKPAAPANNGRSGVEPAGPEHDERRAGPDDRGHGVFPEQ